MLELQNVSLNFGDVKALDELSIRIREGEILGLVGPCGAGKTITANLIAGVHRPSSGDLLFKGTSIAALRPYKRTKLGIACAFQNLRLLSQMTVWENLWNARLTREKGWYGFTERWRSHVAIAREQTEEVLESAGLAPMRDILAGNLMLGEQRRLELGRAALSGAELLVLDAPFTDMTEQEFEDLLRQIFSLRDRGLTFFLAEHRIELAMRACDRVVVINMGRKIAEGTPAGVQQDSEVRLSTQAFASLGPTLVPG